MTMPRRYGGLNFPDCALYHGCRHRFRLMPDFENLWGLQDCAEKHCMNLETKISTAVSFRVSAQAKRCLWT